MKFNIKDNLPAVGVTLFLVLGGAVLGLKFFSPDEEKALVKVTVPALSPQAAQGKKAYDATCAACHGVNGAGGKNGPPLVHDIYNPGHHGDQSFFLAAKRGVPAHHWRFGDMPPQPQMTPQAMAKITAYIRELQRANGIFYRQHRM